MNLSIEGIITKKLNRKIRFEKEEFLKLIRRKFDNINKKKRFVFYFL